MERLSKIIRQQSKQVQFLVVSHRRPMIEAAERKLLKFCQTGCNRSLLHRTVKPPLNETNGRLYINFEDFVREKAEEADSGLF